MNRDYKLTKSKITTGIQCKKKLWFSIHQPLDIGKKATFERGERFNEVIRKHYTKIHGKSLNLSGKWDGLTNKTLEAINSKDINVIFEGTFDHLDTRIRTDVLIRKKDGWELLEAKSSTSLKSEHIPDISIQSFIVRECLKKIGQKLISCKLIHINKDFVLEKNDDYDNLINDQNDISQAIVEAELDIPNYINTFIPLTDKKTSCPAVEMGEYCKIPYKCDYMERCKSLLPKTKETPFTILPYIGSSKELKTYMEGKETMDLQKVPISYFKNRKDYAKDYHYIIQQSHKNNQDWFAPGLSEVFKKYSFPYYFMDFETINQGVPLIKNSKPYESLPFQWSVHKWESANKKIEKGKSFLNFTDQDIERKFIESLLDAVGENGTIFAHNAKGVEIKILQKLQNKESCKDLSTKIDKLINRIEDSLILARMNFYSPLMNGNWSIKSIVKAIPDCPISYDEDIDIGGGDEAQLAWFIYTDPKTNISEKNKQKKNLIEYCAKDTLALYYLIKFLLDKSKAQK